ncbi:hypothetical protein FKW77_010913 [Venturia effusa]|uniref:Uncharacterized protein n=1 Tax=Venturia effusa TaxID=50376 RepID=A0A517KYS6_9PEZI|nr:hypothetical protein FKW77_010913 [Venturia effusa]
MPLNLRLAAHPRNERRHDDTPSPWPLDPSMKKLLLPSSSQSDSKTRVLDEDTRQFLRTAPVVEGVCRAGGASQLDTGEIRQNFTTPTPPAIPIELRRTEEYDFDVRAHRGSTGVDG